MGRLNNEKTGFSDGNFCQKLKNDDQIMRTEYKNFKICLLGATFGTKNMGVSTLTAGIIKCILDQWPDAYIFLLDYGKQRLTYNFRLGDRTIPIKLLNMRFSKKIYLRNNIALLILVSAVVRLVPFEKLRRRIISKNFYLNHVYESHIVASIAGGDSFSDIYGIKRFFYVSLPQLLVVLLDKRLILLPQTLGPFNRGIVRMIARYILIHANKVYSRDYTGLREMQTFFQCKDGAEKLQFCYDVGFVVDPVKPVKMDLGDFSRKRTKDSCVVGLNISGLLYMGGYTRDNMFGLKVDYKDLTLDLIDFMLRKSNTIILLVPHVFGKRRGTESDSAVCEKIYGKLKVKYNNRLFLTRGNYNQNEIKYIIGLCDFFIGSRMHACIAALSQNIPAVAVAYSKKFFGVMESIGFESLVADPREIGKEELMQIINDAFDRRSELKKQLEQKMPYVKEMILNLFRDPTMLY